jgi:hypothetical protein
MKDHVERLPASFQFGAVLALTTLLTDLCSGTSTPPFLSWVGDSRWLAFVAVLVLANSTFALFLIARFQLGESPAALFGALVAVLVNLKGFASAVWAMDQASGVFAALLALFVFESQFHQRFPAVGVHRKMQHIAVNTLGIAAVSLLAAASVFVATRIVMWLFGESEPFFVILPHTGATIVASEIAVLLNSRVLRRNLDAFSRPRGLVFGLSAVLANAIGAAFMIHREIPCLLRTAFGALYTAAMMLAAGLTFPRLLNEVDRVRGRVAAASITAAAAMSLAGAAAGAGCLAYSPRRGWLLVLSHATGGLVLGAALVLYGYVLVRRSPRPLLHAQPSRS